MRNKIKNLCFIFTILCLLNIIGCQDQPEQKKQVVKPVKTMVIKNPTAVTERNFPGKVLASQEAVLSFQVAGQIIELPILEGTLVKAKQLLGRLDPDKYQDRVKETEAKYIRAKAEYERAAHLVKGGYISQTEHDTKKSAYLVSQANYNTAKRNLADTYLYAPFTGLISKKYVEAYEHVQAKQAIFKIQDVSHVDIEVNVPENIMMNVKKDDDGRNKIFAVFSGSTKRYPLKYKKLSTEADQETQTYRLVLTMPAPTDINVLPGMTVTVYAKLPDFNNQGSDFFLVPASAVFSGNDNKSYVWIVDPETMQVKKVAVTVTRLSGQSIHITQGVKPGDRIVTAGVHFLHEGQKIKLLEPQSK